MATKSVYVNLDLQQQELRNVSLEKLSTDPTGGDLYEGRIWYNTTDDRVKYYDGTAVKQVAELDDLEIFGALVGTHDASTGIPTAGSGVAGAIRQGDYWIVTTAGTIAGLSGASTVLSVGDFLFAATDGAATAADFYGVQTNLDIPASIPQVEEVTLSSLPANTATAIPTTFTNVYSIEAYDSSNNKIELCIAGASTAPTAESNVTLTNVNFRVVGV